MDERSLVNDSALHVCGLFAGIGGIELGLKQAGHEATLLCEVDPLAQTVLETRFPGVQLKSDIAKLQRLPEVDLVSAGFPCQDLSVAGRRAGIHGGHSGLVEHLLRLIQARGGSAFRWLLIENVPYMLGLDQGRAMTYLTSRLAALGFAWAYRVVDARAFGIPQRRMRVYMVASRTADPREVLFADDGGSCPVDDGTEPTIGVPYGFYWTEGLRGVGWTGDSIPPIKGGSALGIPSPPAVWVSRTGEIGTIDIRDAERLQGFAANWTKPAEDAPARPSFRWRLVGNAVCVPVIKWVGQRLSRPGRMVSAFTPFTSKGAWPKAAWGYGDQVFEVSASRYPVRRKYRGIEQFLRFPLKPLSAKATRGYLGRAKRCWWYVSPVFLKDVERHLEKVEKAERLEVANDEKASRLCG